MNDQDLVAAIRSLADPNDGRHVARVEAAALRVERRLVDDQRIAADQARDELLMSLGLDVHDLWRTLAKCHAQQADTDAVLADALARITVLEAQRLGGGV